MNKKLDLQFLQTELIRVSEWIRFSDSKSGFLSAFYLAVLGFLISYSEKIKKINFCFNYFHYVKSLFCFFCIIILFLVGVYFLFKSIFPNLKNNFISKSMFYFGHIYNMKFVDYLEEMNKLDEDKAREGLLEQIYTNSNIANEKMKNVKYSINILFVIVLFLIILIL